jgi:hypothetical protein
MVLLSGGEFSALPRYMLMIGLPSAALTALTVPLGKEGLSRLRHLRIRFHGPKILLKRQ